MTNALNWFEIPVADLKRAKKFYTDVMRIKLKDVSMHDLDMAIFPYGEDHVGGALASGEHYQPGEMGALVYLNAGADIDGPISRIEAAGGQVVMPKFQVSPEIGHIAIFKDSEGNHVGLHSPN